MKKYEKLFELSQDLAKKTYGFLETKGPGIGNHATNQFISQLLALSTREFGKDYSEKNICGNNSLAVDFYFPEEGVIVEIALGLKNPNTEYEKDILKALMAKNIGHNVNKLIFISKPGGKKKCKQPGRSAVKEWLLNSSSIELEIWDL